MRDNDRVRLPVEDAARVMEPREALIRALLARLLRRERAAKPEDPETLR